MATVCFLAPGFSKSNTLVTDLVGVQHADIFARMTRGLSEVGKVGDDAACGDCGGAALGALQLFLRENVLAQVRLGRCDAATGCSEVGAIFAAGKAKST